MQSVVIRHWHLATAEFLGCMCVLNNGKFGRRCCKTKTINEHLRMSEGLKNLGKLEMMKFETTCLVSRLSWHVNLFMLKNMRRPQNEAT